MEAFLDPRTRRQIRDLWGPLPGPVTLTLFTQEADCPTCPDLEELLSELASLDPALELERLSLERDGERARALGVEGAPALVVSGARDYGIRFLGTPSGMEFATLLEAIRLASKGESSLSAESLQRLKSLTKPVRIRVFVTPTCPYCPPAVNTAHRIAMAIPGARAEMVEAMEFPELAQRYQVRGVPKIVIEGGESFEGAIPEKRFVEAVVRAGGGA